MPSLQNHAEIKMSVIQIFILFALLHIGTALKGNEWCRLICKDKHRVVWKKCMGNRPACGVYKYPAPTTVKRLEFEVLSGRVDLKTGLAKVDRVSARSLLGLEPCDSIISDHMVTVNNDICVS